LKLLIITIKTLYCPTGAQIHIIRK